MDMENLGSAPDIDNFDASKLDRGDSIAPPEAEKPAPVTDDKVSDIFEGKDDKAVEEPEADDQKVDDEVDDKKVEDEEPAKSRDEKGRFEAKIPKSRFDEAVGKERDAREAAERRAAELERRLAEGQAQQVRTEQIETIEADIAKLEEKHAELLLDGNSKEAATVMRDIRMAERKIARAEADTMANQRITQTLEAQRFETVVARIEADHPEFNTQSETYDPDLVELVLTKQAGLIRSEGLSPSAAMERAANEVADRFLKKEEAPAKEDAKGLAASQAETRKQEQVKKNLDTMHRQPASMKESGIDSDKLGKTSEIDVSKLTSEELAALPASTLAKMRGDFL